MKEIVIFVKYFKKKGFLPTNRPDPIRASEGKFREVAFRVVSDHQLL